MAAMESKTAKQIDKVPLLATQTNLAKFSFKVAMVVS